MPQINIILLFNSLSFMKNFYSQKAGAFIFFCCFFLCSFNVVAQVGIGTTDPNANALLDIDATTVPGGLLLPRLELTRTSDVTPLTAHVRGMTVYNTATAGSGNTAVSPGFYYNDGTQWIRLASSPQADNNWSLTGNTGTNPSNNYLGTTDNTALQFKTRNFSRFEITSGTNEANGGRLRAFTNGTAAQPIYSWNSNVGTGMFQQAANVLGFSTNATERFRIPNANQVHAMAEGTAAAPFYSWSSDSDIGMYRIGANTLGFSTGGSERVRVGSNGNVSIGTSANATEKLEVQGNLRLNGAFMPNNQAGAAGRVLTSNGVGAAPIWGADLGNVNVINRYTTFPGLDINARQKYTVTVTVPGLTTAGSAIVNIQGNWSNDIYDDITIHNIEIRTGEVRFGISNNTGGFLGGGVNYPGMIFNVTVIR